jgi:hypothetical protein
MFYSSFSCSLLGKFGLRPSGTYHLPVRPTTAAGVCGWSGRVDSLGYVCLFSDRRGQGGNDKNDLQHNIPDYLYACVSRALYLGTL